MTDSRNYMHLSKHGALRFMPLLVSKRRGDYQRIHGIDEQLALKSIPGLLCITRSTMQRFGTYVEQPGAEPGSSSSSSGSSSHGHATSMEL